MQLTAASGTVTDSYTCDAFGAMTSHTGTNPQPFGYAGQQQDVGAEGGLLYVRARYYDPALGRFLTQDPLPFLHRYAYAGDDPVNYDDPSGQFPHIPCAACGSLKTVASVAVNTTQQVSGTVWHGAVNYVGGAELAGLYEVGKATTWLLRTDCGEAALDIASYGSDIPNPYAQAVGLTATYLNFIVNAPKHVKEHDWLTAGLASESFLATNAKLALPEGRLADIATTGGEVANSLSNLNGCYGSIQ